MCKACPWRPYSGSPLLSCRLEADRHGGLEPNEGGCYHVEEAWAPGLPVSSDLVTLVLDLE